jgi:hypothetical protein
MSAVSTKQSNGTCSGDGVGLPPFTIRRESANFANTINRQLAENNKLMETAHLCQIVREKVNAHAKGGHTQMRDSYNFFGRARRGITKDAFKEKLNLWSLFLSPEQLDAVFAQIDDDDNGVVSFDEFLRFFGAENNYHPLYKVAKSHAGEGKGGRRLSFLPQKKEQSGSESHAKNAIDDRVKANPKMLASGLVGGVKSALRPHDPYTKSNALRHTKSNALRLHDPSYRNDRNGSLPNGDFSVREVAQFLSRLLQNAHAQVQGGRLYTSPLEYLRSKLGDAPLPPKKFQQILKRDLSRPLCMTPHIIGVALQFYTSPISKRLDVVQILRDAAPLSESIAAMINSNASNMRSIRKHIKHQHMDANGRRSISTPGTSASASAGSNTAAAPAMRIKSRVPGVPIPPVYTMNIHADSTSTGSRSDLLRAAKAVTKAATRAATAGDKAQRKTAKPLSMSLSMPQLAPGWRQTGKGVGGGAMVGGARLVMGGPAGGLQSSVASRNFANLERAMPNSVSSSRPSTSSTSGSYSQRHGLSREEMKNELRRKLLNAESFDASAGARSGTRGRPSDAASSSALTTSLGGWSPQVDSFRGFPSVVSSFSSLAKEGMVAYGGGCCGNGIL